MDCLLTGAAAASTGSHALTLPTQEKVIKGLPWFNHNGYD
jgi:hypothetical protein